MKDHYSNIGFRRRQQARKRHEKIAIAEAKYKGFVIHMNELAEI
jgi:hypothetical protein